MKTLIPTPTNRVIAASELTIAIGLVCYMVLPGSWWIAGLVALILGALVVISSAVVRLARTSAQRGTIVMAVIFTVGLFCAIAYLRHLNSTEDGESAIPIAGVGILFVCWLGLLATAVALWADRSPDAKIYIGPRTTEPPAGRGSSCG